MRAAADFTEQEKSLSTPRGGSKKCQERSRGDTEIARLFLKTLDNGNMRREGGKKMRRGVSFEFTLYVCFCLMSHRLRAVAGPRAKFTEQSDSRFYHNPTLYSNLTGNTDPIHTEECACVLMTNTCANVKKLNKQSHLCTPGTWTMMTG